MKTAFLHRRNRLFLPLLCLFLLFGSCKIQTPLVANEPVYQVQLSLATGNHESDLGILVSEVHASDIYYEYPKSELRRVSLRIHGDGALKIFRQQLAQLTLPVLDLKITNTNNYNSL